MRASSGRHRHRLGLIIGALVLTAVATEVLLRVGLRTATWDRLGQPAAYFDPLCDDNHWRALRRGAWGQALHRISPQERHSTLGWTPHTASLDSRGAFPTLSPPRNPESTIALFGDSYIFGTTPQGTRIADALSALRPEAEVLNFGVGGYGLDQILLRLEDRVGVLPAGSWVFIGALTTDIDRTILQVRDAPKPWFTLSEGGALRLNPPPDVPVAQWFDDHPITATSLLWQRLRRTWQLRAAQGSESTEPHCAVAQKRALTHALLSRMASVCAEAQLSCALLSMQRPIDLTQGAGWRAELYRSAPHHGLGLIDTGPLMKSLPEGWSDLYGADSHPSPAGNRQLATWIDQFLSEQSPKN